MIAFALALIARRRRWLVGPIVGLTGVLYTLPSLAVFFLLLPITGRGNTTAIIALTAYTLQIIFRNIVLGLQNVPEEARDAGRGVGLTDRQLLWRVELPLAIPDIVAGLRIATTSTVGLATLAVFAGAGGLGEQIISGSNITFKTGVVAAGGLAMLMAFALDVILLGVQRALTPWRRAQAGMIELAGVVLSTSGTRSTSSSTRARRRPAASRWAGSPRCGSSPGST